MYTFSDPQQRSDISQAPKSDQKSGAERTSVEQSMSVPETWTVNGLDELPRHNAGYNASALILHIHRLRNAAQLVLTSLTPDRPAD